MMSSYTREKTRNSESPERDAQPADDGHPERSGAPRAQMVPDDARAYEEQHTGIRISYRLKEDEVYECLRRILKAKAGGGRPAAARAALLVAAAALGAAGGGSGSGVLYALAAVCAVCAALSALFPLRADRRLAREYAGNAAIRMRVYPDRIQLARDGRVREIPLDGTSECAQIGDMLALYVRDPQAPGGLGRRLVVLPLRCVDPSALPEVQAMIFAGTRPLKVRG
ncbi:MAG TPA: hypothetical protein DCL64_07755 [Ruminococcaceae bacterium]|jgi:hypothetical protein|nr:hypothetical protein [Oscillospiraceae bacterium]